VFQCLSQGIGHVVLKFETVLADVTGRI